MEPSTAKRLFKLFVFSEGSGIADDVSFASAIALAYA